MGVGTSFLFLLAQGEWLFSRTVESVDTAAKFFVSMSPGIVSSSARSPSVSLSSHAVQVPGRSHSVGRVIAVSAADPEQESVDLGKLEADVCEQIE